MWLMRLERRRDCCQEARFVPVTTEEYRNVGCISVEFECAGQQGRRRR